jgi:hypothetical protein
MNITEAFLQINYAVERAHGRYLTCGFGQIAVYQEKAEQAADYIAAKYPKNVAGYPLIQAEVHATNKCSKEVADSIIAAKSEFVALAAKIEEIRLGAKYKLRKEKTDAQIERIVKKTIEALDAI